MKGHILNFSNISHKGVISGEDQIRYSFHLSEWKEENLPQKGDYVDFSVNYDGSAMQIYSLKELEINFRKNVIQEDHTKNEENYNIMDWFIKCLKNYANFHGRARRKEYWFFLLATYLILIITVIMGMITSSLILTKIVYLALLTPSLAVGARRLHDIGRSGWWMFIALVPLFGPIIVLVWNITDTKPEVNSWGIPSK